MRDACDTHVHFYDGRHPVAAAAVIRPADATPDDYRRVQADLGTDRLVVVQPTTYGLDNCCQLDAMAAFGAAARGVMVVDEHTPSDELARLSDVGVRGARFHMLLGGAVRWDVLEAVAARIAPFGWHVQLQLNGRELAGRCERLLRLPVGLVVDHVGRFMPPVRPDSLDFAALLRLVDQGAHVKLSAPYESSTSGPPDFADVTEMVGVLVARAPERLLWASNWPHPGQPDAPTPAELVALRDRWLPTGDLRRRVLVENPAGLYEF
jgi:D-galactarolactone isomerase